MWKRSQSSGVNALNLGKHQNYLTSKIGAVMQATWYPILFSGKKMIFTHAPNEFHFISLIKIQLQSPEFTHAPNESFSLHSSTNSSTFFHLLHVVSLRAPSAEKKRMFLIIVYV